jgi:REP element-mobilizing transposase RayT
MNKYNPNIHHRRSIRLKGYDYSQAGLYFVTICVKNRECLFGNIADGEMILNDAGQMVESEWLKLPERFTNIVLHEYIVMPNHFHAILQIVGATLVAAQNNTVAQNNMIDATEKGQPQGIAPTRKTVGDMVGAFESITTVEYIRGVKNKNWKPFDGKLWQRNYWEHIICNEKSYQTISDYIINNPLKWNDDKLNPDKKGE